MLRKLRFNSVPNCVKFMNITLFYITLLFTAMVGVIESKLTINALLWLVTAFISGSLFFMHIGADFIGLLFIIVYVGAVGMFFLFMIMLLDPKISIKPNIILGEIIMFAILVFISLFDVRGIVGDYLLDESWVESSFNIADLGSIALTLYDWYGWPLIVLSLLLFMAMLVAIDIARSKAN